MRTSVAVLLGSLMFTGHSYAQSFGLLKKFDHSWLNLNYVPCEGLGVTASGKIELAIDYFVVLPGKPNPITLMRDAYLTASYAHETDVAASLSFISATGYKTINLVKPWYPTIGSADVVQLIFPRPPKPLYGLPRIGPLQTQQAQDVKTGTPLKLNVGIRFPKEGGSCFATFKQTFTLD